VTPAQCQPQSSIEQDYPTRVIQSSLNSSFIQTTFKEPPFNPNLKYTHYLLTWVASFIYYSWLHAHIWKITKNMRRRCKKLRTCLPPPPKIIEHLKYILNISLYLFLWFLFSLKEIFWDERRRKAMIFNWPKLSYFSCLDCWNKHKLDVNKHLIYVSARIHRSMMSMIKFKWKYIMLALIHMQINEIIKFLSYSRTHKYIFNYRQIIINTIFCLLLFMLQW
jgi:hypothetical protein